MVFIERFEKENGLEIQNRGKYHDGSRSGEGREV